MAENLSKNNHFNEIVNSLMEGAGGVLTSKTVMGEPVQVGDTIIIPLNDVSIGCAGGSNIADKKDAGMGGFTAKMSPSAVLVIRGGNTKVVSIKDQNSLSRLIDTIPEVVDKITAMQKEKTMMSDEDAVNTAFPEEEQK